VRDLGAVSRPVEPVAGAKNRLGDVSRILPHRRIARECREPRTGDGAADAHRATGGAARRADRRKNGAVSRAPQLPTSGAARARTAAWCACHASQVTSAQRRTASGTAAGSLTAATSSASESPPPCCPERHRSCRLELGLATILAQPAQ